MILTHQNPQATQGLTLNVTVACNTTDEVILRNVLTNSHRPNKWIKREEAHDGIALICGSGPSLADCLQMVIDLQWRGAKVFALNNAANFLDADYQVILDARPETASLIGPARNHLIASQCDPSIFEALPDAILWHCTHGDILVDEQEGFPHREDYCLIGGGATVGNTALPLVYAMGYRNVHIFGMDSCHRKGKGHVLPQPMNDDDPLLTVRVGDREFLCSYTMKEQAEFFASRAQALKTGGCSIHVHGDGYLQALWHMDEKTKYQEMWTHPEYREVSPGEHVAKTFVDVVKPRPFASIGDFGCGTGRGSLAISKLTDCRLTLIDFAENCRDEEARKFRFVQADLTKCLSIHVNYGFCTDVMEHIEPENVNAVIRNIMDSCGSCFFQISTVPDSMGVLVGHALHLTVQPFEWWKQKFISLGYAVSWEEKQEQAALFYIG